MGSDMVGKSAVTVFQVPVAGERVWFISDDELTAGGLFDGVIAEVGLTHAKVIVNFSPSMPEDEWNLPINDPNFKLWFSYESFLEDECQRLAKENREYRKLFGPLIDPNYVAPPIDDDIDFM